MKDYDLNVYIYIYIICIQAFIYQNSFFISRMFSLINSK
jgi:hypothetical protein